MIIPSATQIKEIDEHTIRQRNLTSLCLMESAAREAALFIFQHITDYTRPIIVFAGPGNNGGDGLALARMIRKQGYTDLRVYLFNTNGTLSADCKANADRLREECPDVAFKEIVQQFEAPETEKSTVVIDALFGIGLNKPLGGGYAALVRFINASGAEVISLDMPSGLMSEDNTFNSPTAIVRADYTLSFGLPKLAQLLPDNQVYCGRTYVLPIGLSLEGYPVSDCLYTITEAADIRRMLRPRHPFGHKGTFGHALLTAGRYGMAGAAILAARACLKSGVGKLTVHTPRRNNDILQTAVPEAILSHDTDENVFSTPIQTAPFQAIGIGPAIGTEKKTCLAMIEQVSHTSVPLVIDADAISILGDHKGWIQQVPPGTIFTPHPGELCRLGICNKDSYSILMEALNLARRHGFYIILKGHYTAVCTPEGRVYFNPTGNSGMATAGSGDVLTGIILSLAAQDYPVLDACRLGVYLHGLAGDIAAEELGEHCVTATDLIHRLPAAFKRLKATPPETAGSPLKL